MKTLYLCGAGNSEAVRLAQVINEAHGCWDEILLLDDDPSMHGEAKLGVPVVGAFSKLGEAAPGSAEVRRAWWRPCRARRRLVRVLGAVYPPRHSVLYSCLQRPRESAFGQPTGPPGATGGAVVPSIHPTIDPGAAALVAAPGGYTSPSARLVPLCRSSPQPRPGRAY